MENIRIAEQTEETINISKDRETEALMHQFALSSKTLLDCFSEFFPMVTDERLQLLGRRYRDLFENCTENGRSLLAKQGSVREKTTDTPNFSRLSTQVKLAFRSDSSTIAALLFDHCHALIRDLYAALHQTQGADGESRRTVYRLIGTAEDFRDELKDFL